MSENMRSGPRSRPQAAAKPKCRLYCTLPLEEGKSVKLMGEQGHYLAKVMRLKPGEALVLFNEHQGEWLAYISQISKQGVETNLVQQLRNSETLPYLRLAFAPLRKERLAFLIEKAIELGVTELQPVISDHTNWKMKSEKLDKIALEATEQSERLDLIKCAPAMSFSDFLNQASSTAPLIVGLERANDLPTLGETPVPLGDKPTFWVGPEGGWSETESLALQSQAHVKPVGLGLQILRAETAAIKAIVLIQAQRHTKFN